MTEPVETVETIEFAPGLLLDIYRQTDARGPAPVIVWLHGGAWRLGDRTWAPDLGRYFAAVGFAMVSIDYTLSGQSPFPAPLFDVRSAIRWVREHAAEYGFDPDAIGLWGSSAGGHLAALAAVLGRTGRLDGEQASSTSAEVHAVVDGYGAADLLAPDQSVPPTEGLLGGPVAEHRELAIAASPARRVSAGAPPFLILHGAADALVPASQSVTMFEALAAVDADATLYLIEGFGHGFFNPAGTTEVDGPPIDAGHLEADPAARAEVRSTRVAGAAEHPPASFGLVEAFFRAHLGAPALVPVLTTTFTNPSTESDTDVS
ncbi:MAG: Isoprenylcysteine alpha-carbonyl methylesterase [Subtercola sp.]|nr:Isoprenylcysteine alpha-carbonyl methylesterase [Subtercola sp.]